MKSMKKPSYYYHQSAVIPFLYRHGKLFLVLISSRSRKSWVLPKGIVEPDLTAVESAEKEAFEEAGITGPVSPALLGTYRYEKWGGICSVRVFAQRVEKLHEDWPEKDFRERLVIPFEESEKYLHQHDVIQIIKKFSEILKITAENDANA